jgi:hypothetical protein
VASDTFKFCCIGVPVAALCIIGLFVPAKKIDKRLRGKGFLSILGYRINYVGTETGYDSY